jgi:hypothetical protein
MQGATNQPVSSQFAAKSAKLASALVQNRIGHAARAAKTGYDSTHRGNLYLSRCVTHQIHFTAADAALYGNPLFVNGNARALPFEGLEALFFQESIETTLGVLAVFADDAKRGAIRGLRNRPVEIRSIVGNEPNPGCVLRAIFGKFHHGLNQGDSFHGRPASGASDPADRAIGAD